MTSTNHREMPKLKREDATLHEDDAQPHHEESSAELPPGNTDEAELQSDSSSEDDDSESDDSEDDESNNDPRHEVCECEHEDDEENPLGNFAAVLAALNLDALPQVAAETRRKLEWAEYENPTVGDPMNGSYHILFPLQFSDGVCWLAKIPINGVEGKWDALSAATLSSEANTMRLLKRETTIPVPQVFDFSSTTANKLNCPYIFMSFISGRPLQDVWFNRDVDADTLHSHRVRALEGVAAAMHQLGKYTFDRGGTPLFDSNGNLQPGVGPMRSTDAQAELDRWFVDKDPSTDPIYVEQPPSRDARGFYTFVMDLHPPSGKFAVMKGARVLQHHLINWLPKTVGPKFVLAHPDFDIQNILVAEDGQLQGIIDWDGVVARPRSTGNEAYPSWLTRDWDTMMYHYARPADEVDGDDEDILEDSPEALKRYRQVYRQCFSKAKGLGDQQRGDFGGQLRSLWSGWFNPLSCFAGRRQPTTDSDVITRQSLVVDNVIIAATNPTCQTAILRKVLKEISSVSDDDDEAEDLNFLDVVEALAGNEEDESLLKSLKCGFEKLLEMDF
ncbi:hypothetical protein AK830_g1369 [Neonectria ditissima]|uniref:Aminoglycoside phosphotransferase domain-containing protein n=1 Tax=Neonectria ditissima TaxID=78410 RepID=A0A0P7BF12_9HYPO|nr:hypothetical protein AK830_g1369 [Neonectria ditissima]